MLVFPGDASRNMGDTKLTDTRDETIRPVINQYFRISYQGETH